MSGIYFISLMKQNGIFLYINTMQAIVLPKRYFSPQEIIFLETLIKEKLGQKISKKVAVVY